jgi:exodeoxyribonuclease-3
MKLATWNVNSIRARLERVLAWIEHHRPDVLCLQETKVEDAAFPTAELEQRGYHVAAHGQRTYNGVAILSRTPLADVTRGFGDGDEDTQSRFLAAATHGMRVMSVYVPNGESVGSEKFRYKLGWMARLRRQLATRLATSGAAVVCGDFNVAPAPLDVHDPVAWEGRVLFSAEERAALATLAGDAGLVDLLRTMHPTEPLYTWWDYRMLGFPKNRGLRIDHVLVTPALAARATASGVDRESRKGQQPSDHAAVWAEFRDE